MQSRAGSRVLLAGVAGIVLGVAAQELINARAQKPLVADGMLWGAVLGVLIASLPSFSRMGALVAKTNRPVVHFVVGVALFILISLVIVALFLGLFALLGQVFT
jgi:protein-S-isoprenylcysteine O-methyltransferase Ste14